MSEFMISAVTYNLIILIGLDKASPLYILICSESYGRLISIFSEKLLFLLTKFLTVDWSIITSISSNYHWFFDLFMV